MAHAELDPRQLTARLAPLGVENLRPLGGGASSLTYLGTIAGDDSRRVVVKVAPAGVPPVLNRDVLRQARLLRAVHSTAVPVPGVLWEDAGAPPQVPPLFVMSYVEGTSLEPLFDPDGEKEEDEEEETLVAERMRNATRAMASLHALPLEVLGLADEPRVGPREEIGRWCRLLETVDPTLAPGWDAVAAALRASEPPALPSAVVHGDFRLGNILAVGARIAAIIDWEIWSVGDPRVDVGWFLVNADPDTYQRATQYAGSLPEPAELAQIYRGLGSEVPDLEWFQALACFKSTATWSLIVKHDRRRAKPTAAIQEMAAALPRLLDRAHEHLR